MLVDVPLEEWVGLRAAETREAIARKVAGLFGGLSAPPRAGAPAGSSELRAYKFMVRASADRRAGTLPPGREAVLSGTAQFRWLPPPAAAPGRLAQLEAWVRSHGGRALPRRRKGADGATRQLAQYVCELRAALRADPAHPAVPPRLRALLAGPPS